MATSAFRSTTKRTPIASSTSSTAANETSSSSATRDSAIRRSRSLSRFSRRLAIGNDDSSVDDPPRGRFVSTVRGSCFPEITLDGLAIDFFGSAPDRGRSHSGRRSDVSPSSSAVNNSRRGRSVSRKSSAGSYNSGGGSTSSEIARRRRSVSVVRCPISDSESDVDNLHKSACRASSVVSSRASSQKPVSRKPKISKEAQSLRRSTSQKDFKPYDDYSSHSSALTDEEVKDVESGKGAMERTIRAVYAQKAEHPMGEDMNAGLYQAMREELRNAVEQMRMDLEQVILKSNPSLANGGQLPLDDADLLRAVSSIRRNNTSKLQQSERCKPDLLAELLLEEERGKDISKIVKDLPAKSKANGQEKLRSRKRSNDRCRMSKRLSEEAEKYIQDFISNVEDTDISSLDGERSDTSSTIGVVLKLNNIRATADRQPPAEMDGVVLPWLQWETSDDVCTPSREQTTMRSPPTGKSSYSWNAIKESFSSLGSCSLGSVSGPSATESYAGNLTLEMGKSDRGRHGGRFDLDEYVNGQSEEEFLVERWRQAQPTCNKAAGCRVDEEIDDWLPITNSRNPKWWHFAFHNVTAMVGASVLGLPHAMSKFRWGPGVMVMSCLGLSLCTPRGRWWRCMKWLRGRVGVNIVDMIAGRKSLKKFHDTMCAGCKPIKTTYFIMIFASAHFVLSHLPSFQLFIQLIAWVASEHTRGDIPGCGLREQIVHLGREHHCATSRWPFVGYPVFGNSVQDNILISLEKTRWLMATMNLFVVVHLIGSSQVRTRPHSRT
ncbi:hypothetical protein MLD38_012586 [Melastoma candidum]|uniref:Uncharacterized protein n=1 Tax=Melastoma candidum TaxID=119954 RepID=A0ACB9R6D4_9MYRT|nr:hypothetical protein MLD38_012586 [Melastoma candidum]